jgi:hypothetical protein
VSGPLPKIGSIYSFRTAPLSEFAAQAADRFGALKMLGANGACIVIAVLDCIWMKPPTLGEAFGCAILREHHYFHTGALAAFGGNAEWWTLSKCNPAKA